MMSESILLEGNFGLYFFQHMTENLVGMVCISTYKYERAKVFMTMHSLKVDRIDACFQTIRLRRHILLFMLPIC